jgi:hypothetical protein
LRLNGISIFGHSPSAPSGGLILVRCSLGEARASVRNSVSPKFGESISRMRCILIRQISRMFRLKLEMSGNQRAGASSVLHPRAREKPAVDGAAAAVADEAQWQEC